MMEPARTLKHYRTLGGWVGAIAVGVVFLIVAMLQPIDGIPGYKYVTAEDSSILWGFALSAVIGAVVGGAAGVWLGGRMGSKRLAQRAGGGFSPQPAGSPSFPAPQAAQFDVQRIGEEFDNLMAEGVFEKSEEYLGRGQQPDRDAVTRYAVERAAATLMARYRLSQAEMVRLIEQHVQKGTK